MEYSIGSKWRKWDLHVHTPESKLNNQFPDWDTYVKELYNRAIANDFSVIGITDYFTIEGYKKLVNDYVNNETKLREIFSEEIEADSRYIEKIKKILVLPNIEFRLDKILSSKKDGQQPRRLNYHVIFSNEISITDIEENFLHELEFEYEGGPHHGFDRRKLKIHNLDALGQKLKSEHPPFASESDFVVGCKNAVVKLDQIEQILKKDKPKLFENKYIMVFAEEYTSLIDWDSQDHNTKKVILAVSDMIFSSNDNTRKWALTDEFEQEFATKKPCIWGSDSHSVAALFCHDNDKFCWIKADTTFRGFLQLRNEPQDRIFIGKIPPKLLVVNSNKSQFIKSIKVEKVTGSDLQECWFDNEIAPYPI